MSISICMKKLLLSTLLGLAAVTAQAQEIEFTVHHAPGGPSDRSTRLLASELPKNYTVVNRPGASGKIAVKALMSKPAVMIATMPQIFVTNPLMFDDLEYQPNKDLELVAVIGAMPSVLACNNKLGFKSFEDVKSSTKSLNFGVAGYGSSEHIATAVLLTQWKNSHQVIPYAQGGSTSLTDLLAGNIDCMFANFPLVKGYVGDNSKITMLMSSHDVGAKLPTWSQVFKAPYPLTSHLGLIVNKNLEPKIKAQIYKDVAQAISKQGFDQEIVNMGLFPILKMDSVTVSESLVINVRLRDFLIKNQLKLKP